MEIYLIISLFVLTASQQCIAGTNCPLNQGICVGGACECLEGYKTFYKKDLPLEQQIFCNYQQINHFIPLALEFFPGIGLGHLYIGRYWQGIIKLCLAVIFLSCNFYLYKELKVPSYVEAIGKSIINKIIPDDIRSGNGGITRYDIAQALFNITFHPFWILWLFDIYMFFMKSYNDGNGIPLI